MGRPSRGWMNDITEKASKNWLQVAQDGRDMFRSGQLNAEEDELIPNSGLLAPVCDRDTLKLRKILVELSRGGHFGGGVNERTLPGLEVTKRREN
ncbi:hypothetical protein Trydic_g3664 [Trypoxylus dichotomus]